MQSKSVIAMARILKEFPKSYGRGRRFGGDPSWFNGQVWELDIATDLSRYKDVKNARGAMVQHAARKGLKIRTSTDINKGIFIMQAYR